ncbi:MAG: methyltransferase domain-containing protein [Isosphaeraceae bacterium]
MTYDKAQATHEFNRWSESYDRSILQLLLFGPSHRALLKRIGAFAGDRPVRILDIGCGTGVFAERVRQTFPNATVWGIDLVSGMLRKGTERWRRCSGVVQPVQGDSERLPFADGSFDVLTCANSFHHYPHQERAIREMNRVLRPGGRLLLIDGYRDAPWGWFIYDVCVEGVEGAVHHASAAEFRTMFARAGMTGVTQRVHRGPAPFLLNEAVGTEAPSVIPSPHFHTIPQSQPHANVVRG